MLADLIFSLGKFAQKVRPDVPCVGVREAVSAAAVPASSLFGQI